MTVLLENLLVALLVTGCAVFSIWRLLSPQLRMRVLDVAGPALAMISERWVARLRSRTLQQLAGPGCGSCSRATATAVHRRPLSADLAHPPELSAPPAAPAAAAPTRRPA